MNSNKGLVGRLESFALGRLFILDGEKRNYHHLQVLLTAIMISIALVPVLITAALSYYCYSDLVRHQETAQLEMRAEVKVESVSSMVDDLASLIRFAARGENPAELKKEDSLEELYMRIAQEHPFIVDIGVIDHNGVQQGYFGPFNLLGIDYSETTWLKEVLSQGDYISDVFMGNRNIPHYTIAVADVDKTTMKQWILRVNINASTLQKYINRIKTSNTADLFLVNENGRLQTKSVLFGDGLENEVPEEVLNSVAGSPVTRGENLYITLRVPDTPWLLVMVNEIYTHRADWLTFRNKLAYIIFFCFVVSVAVVYYLVRLITTTIRNADNLQLSVIKESEHQDRLASIGRLAAGVGHEINNPLAIIDQKKGLVEDLIEMSGDFENKKVLSGCMESIGRSVERCKVVTHRLLGFARQQDSVTVPLNVNPILLDVYEFLENALTHSRIDIKFHLDEDLPNVIGDQIELQQVFLNIMNNAIDAIGKDGTITISSQKIAGDVCIIIQDDGPGMEKDVIMHIFEPFFTTKETGKGTGLGLSITYGLVKKMGGEITVTSTIGVGTAFTINIPTQ